MDEMSKLYALYTATNPKLETFLTQIIEKLGGKKLGSQGNVLGVFSQPSHACHGAMYFLQKCLEQGADNARIAVVSSTKKHIVKDAQFLFKETQIGQCLTTSDILLEIGSIDIESETIGTTQFPSASLSSDLCTLTKFKHIVIESSSEDFFDYSNIEAPEDEPLPANPSTQDPEPMREKAPSALEVSEVNQIYDFQEEHVTREEEKAKKLDENSPEEDTEKTSIPSYALEPIERTNAGAKTIEKATPTEEQSQPDIIPDKVEFSPPTPGIKGILEDRNLMITLLIGFLSLGSITYFAVNGNPFTSSEEGQFFEQASEVQENTLDGLDSTPSSAEEPLTEASDISPPPKRTFVPILTQDEINHPEKQQQTMFPQQPSDNTAYLAIKSQPPGATVYINGAQLRGKTPLGTFLVYANQKLDIKVVKSGYDPVTKTDNIPPGKRKGFLFELVANE